MKTFLIIDNHYVFMAVNACAGHHEIFSKVIDFVLKTHRVTLK